MSNSESPDPSAGGASERHVHTETMELDAPPEKVREFIVTPDRILDYFPSPLEGGVLEEGQAIYCRGEMGTSILERIESECRDDLVVIKVTTAIGLDAPYTRERIEAGCTFTMIEDWALAPRPGGGTTLTKTWRDIESPAPPPFPLADAVKQGAIHESAQLVAGWNKAARD